MGYAAANTGTAVTQILTVELIAKASAKNLVQVQHLPPQLQRLVLEEELVLAASLVPLFLTNCLNTEMMEGAPRMDSTHMMLSLLLLALSMALAPPVMTPPARRSLLLSWRKLLMKPQVIF